MNARIVLPVLLGAVTHWGCATGTHAHAGLPGEARMAESDDLVPEPVAESPEFPGLEQLDDEFGAVRIGRGPDFAISSHRDVILALEGMAKECTTALVRAQWELDLLHQFNSAAHFDNCNFAGGVRFVRQRLDRAEAASRAGEVLGAMRYLGHAVHAIQDFYSHSDYVERMHEKHESFEDVPIVAFWNEDGEQELNALVAAGLVTGRFVLTGNRLVGQDFCPADAPGHGTLAKDSNKPPAGSKLTKWEARTQHEAALELADRATRAFLRNAIRRLPAVGETCGVALGYSRRLDRRAE